MPPIWTSPRTWTNGEIPTASIMNEHIRDNLDYLFARPVETSVLNAASDYTTTSTLFVDIHGTDLSRVITTSGGRVLVLFSAFVTQSASNKIKFDVAIDGVRVSADDGLLAVDASTTVDGKAIAIMYVTPTAPAAGVHTVKLQWCVSGGTATLYAGAGTSGLDIHPQFIVMEV